MLLAVAVVGTPAGAGAQSPFEPADPPAVERSLVATRWQLRSTTLGEDRAVRVLLPESHARTTRPYPLLLVLDGEAILFDVAEAARTLAEAGHMPEVVVVGIENTDRIRDLSPPGVPVSGNDGRGRSDAFVRFLRDELQPALSERFRASGPIWLVGHSSGGLFVHWAVEPEWAVGVLSLDAPVHLGDGAVARRLLALTEAAVSRPVRLVSMEARFGWPDELWARLVDAAPDTWLLVRERLGAETHGSVVAPGSYRGLQALFRDYSVVGDRALPPAERLARFDDRVARGQTGGAPEDADALPPPAALLREVASDRIAVLDLGAARDAVGRLERGYGADAASAELRARLAAADPDALQGPTLEELQGTPMARPDEVQGLVGEWRGVLTTDGRSSRDPLSLSLRVVADSVVADISVGGAPPRSADYLMVDGSTVHVGYMNGMNPRGMLLYEGSVDGDVFEGRFELRGVVFRMPDGRPLPVTRFRLERVRR